MQRLSVRRGLVVWTVTILIVVLCVPTIAAQERPDTEPPLRNEIAVEGGSFHMGSNDASDWGASPVHTVHLDSFSMMATEVTFEAYDMFALATGRDLPYDDGWGRGNRPVIYVTWYDAIAYANWLSNQDGLTPAYQIDKTNVMWDQNADGWRLPTEAEWEYAARGGRRARETMYAGGDDIGEVAWYWDNAEERTHPVGEKRANELGLYDMTGNVWEWCWDRYGDYEATPASNPMGPSTGDARVIRGGGWNYEARFSRVALRYAHDPGRARYEYGFRLVRN